jgi:hypothetical protein
MDQVIWIEVLRNRAVVARHRVAGGAVRVGRGYGNDVVLDDPHVAPEHIRIVRDAAGVLVAEDLGSHNGMFADDQRQRVPRMVLDGTATIRIGTTHLRVRGAAFPVAPERPLVTRRPVWPVALALAIILLAERLAFLWLNETAKPQTSSYAVPLLILALVAIAWAGFWSLLSHVFSGRARFLDHLAVGLAGLTLFTLLSALADLVEFSLSWPLPSAAGTAALWLALALVAFIHLQILGPGRLAIKGGSVAALAGAAIAIQLLSFPQSDAPSVNARRLFPPATRLAPAQREDAFFAKVDKLQAELDKDRTKPP